MQIVLKLNPLLNYQKVFLYVKIVINKLKIYYKTIQNRNPFFYPMMVNVWAVWLILLNKNKKK